MLSWLATQVSLLLLLLLLSSLTTDAGAFYASAGSHAQQQPRGNLSITRRPHHSEYSRRTFRAMANTGSTGAAAAAGGGSDGACGGGTDTPLFVYGTLMNEKVLLALLDRVPSTKKARLSGYHRYRIKDHVFPAIRPRDGGSVEGLLMTGLDSRERLIFDLFEDDDYHKVDVEVTVEASEGEGDTRTATSYVWNASAEDQLYGTWEPTVHFTASGPVPDYVSMVQRFSKEIEEEGLLDNAAAGANAV